MFELLGNGVLRLPAEEKIDILVNNAGVFMYPKFKLTEDGHESTWQGNYLGKLTVSLQSKLISKTVFKMLVLLK